ncbi:MAG: hypothetical protein LUF35_09595 [Lachnospiraceae bacterium]|nr:hypothetical protein [Lachnospiraceae bacterium]
MSSVLLFLWQMGHEEEKRPQQENVQPLRFSKSGNPKIERTYSTHYVDGKRIAELKTEAEQKKAKMMELDTSSDTDSVESESDMGGAFIYGR